MRKIKVFDTTLRDGEQTPGATMTINEKIKIAKQLDILGVDIIEAGFAASSNGDFEAIQAISESITNATVCSLARASEKDIELAAKAISNAKNQRIHTFIATSDIHMKYKLKMERDEVFKRAVRAVEYAKTFTDDVQFSFEDATRTDIGLLFELSTALIEARVKTINLPDTVGFRTPREIGLLVSKMKDVFGNKIDLSIHNHNDLGLATANTLEGILCGANQVECTINGIGERAGNAALEEIVMGIKVKDNFFKSIYTDINIKELYPTSRLVSYVTGIEPQPNKAIVGKNAFSHESGIHQHGFLENKETYQIINPEDIGKTNNDSIVLGKLSGRRAFKAKIKELGLVIEDDKLDFYFSKFKDLADYKKEILDEDIRAIVSNEKICDIVKFKKLDFINNKLIIEIDGVEKSSYIQLSTDGIINQIFKSIDSLIGDNGLLLDYTVKAVTNGKDSLANSFVKVSFNEEIFTGHGLNIDTIVSSCEAYVSTINQYLSKNRGEKI